MCPNGSASDRKGCLFRGCCGFSGQPWTAFGDPGVEQVTYGHTGPRAGHDSPEPREPRESAARDAQFRRAARRTCLAPGRVGPGSRRSGRGGRTVGRGGGPAGERRRGRRGRQDPARPARGGGGLGRLPGRGLADRTLPAPHRGDSSTSPSWRPSGSPTSRPARSSTSSPNGPTAKGCCSSSTPASTSSPTAPRSPPPCSPARPACASWSPAANASRCPARRSCTSNRCRWKAPTRVT